MKHRYAIAAMLLLLSACGAEAPAAEPPAAAAVVDSVFSPEESLRRLRAGLPEPTALTGGAPSRDALVRGLFAGLASGDTAGVVAMHLTRAEFAWLYYPPAAAAATNPLDPALMWSLLRLESEKGLNRIFTRLAGVDVGFAGYTCEDTPRREGANRLWERCRVELTTPPADFAARRLFGTIIERDGRFKFVSFKTDL